MDKENQDRIVLEFLKRVAKELEKETGKTGWECSVDEEDPVVEEEVDIYFIENKSLISPFIVGVNVKSEEILIFIYNRNEAIFDNILKSIKEKLPKIAKELKINKWKIYKASW